MKAIAVIPGTPNSIHLRDAPRPSLGDVPGDRGVLVKVLHVGVDGTDKEINAAEYGASPPRLARREERAYREYVRDEQRSQPGCSGGQNGTVIPCRALRAGHLPGRALEGSRRRDGMKAIAVIPGTPNSIHLRDAPRPSLGDVPGDRGVLVKA